MARKRSASRGGGGHKQGGGGSGESAAGCCANWHQRGGANGGIIVVASAATMAWQTGGMAWRVISGSISDMAARQHGGMRAPSYRLLRITRHALRILRQWRGMAARVRAWRKCLPRAARVAHRAHQRRVPRAPRITRRREAHGSINESGVSMAASAAR
jgi:hypothetical protein